MRRMTVRQPRKMLAAVQKQMLYVLYLLEREVNYIITNVIMVFYFANE